VLWDGDGFFRTYLSNGFVQLKALPPRRMRNIRVKCNLAARMRIFRRPSGFLIIMCTCGRMLDPKYLCQRWRNPP